MKHLLIVGRPGCGKTTLVKRLAQGLRGCAIDGFYTEECREDDQRVGFWLSSLDGRQVLLAHRRLDSPYRVGAYRVNVAVLDDVAIGVIRRAMRTALILFIDELGRMELCSQAFQRTVEEAFIRGPRIVATGGLQRLPVLEELRHRKDVEFIPLSQAMWPAVFEELLARLRALCDEDHQAQAFQRQADRICEMIVSGDVPEMDIEIHKARLRDEIARLFPDRSSLYELVYESRFRRLWQQFRHG